MSSQKNDKVTKCDLSVNTLAFNSKGDLASGSDDETIKIWDIGTGKCSNTLRGHSGRVKALAFKSEDLLMSGSIDRTIKSWNIRTGECYTIKDHTEGHLVRDKALVIKNEDSLASGSKGGTNKILNINVDKSSIKLSDAELQEISEKNCVNALAFNSQRLLLAAGCWHNIIRIRVKDIYTDTWICSNEFVGHGDSPEEYYNKTRTTDKYPNSVVAVAFFERFLACGFYDGEIEIWDTDKRKCLETLKKHSNSVDALAFNKDGLLASGSWNGMIDIWKKEKDGWVHSKTFGRHTYGQNAVKALAFNSEGLLASGSDDRTIKIWNTDTDTECLKTFEGHDDCVKALAFNSEDLLASGSADGKIKIWKVQGNVDTWEFLKTLDGHVARTSDG